MDGAEKLTVFACGHSAFWVLRFETSYVEYVEHNEYSSSNPIQKVSVQLRTTAPQSLQIAAGYKLQEQFSLRESCLEANGMSATVEFAHVFNHSRPQ